MFPVFQVHMSRKSDTFLWRLNSSVISNEKWDEFTSSVRDISNRIELPDCDDKQLNFRFMTVMMSQINHSREAFLYITTKSFQFVDENCNIIIIIKLGKNDNKKMRAWATSRAFKSRAPDWVIFPAIALFSLAYFKGRSRCHSFGVISQSFH